MGKDGNLAPSLFIIISCFSLTVKAFKSELYRCMWVGPNFYGPDLSHTGTNPIRPSITTTRPDPIRPIYLQETIVKPNKTLKLINITSHTEKEIGFQTLTINKTLDITAR